MACCSVSWRGLPGLSHARNNCCAMAAMLEGKATIPQVQANCPSSGRVQTDSTTSRSSPLLRRRGNAAGAARELIRGFLVEGGEGKNLSTTALPTITGTDRGAKRWIPATILAVPGTTSSNRYIMEHHGDTLAILSGQNIPTFSGQLCTELEHIFTCELGSKEGLCTGVSGLRPLVCPQCARWQSWTTMLPMQAFSKFINDESLNAKQIVRAERSSSLHQRQNGYVESSKRFLMKHCR